MRHLSAALALLLLGCLDLTLPADHAGFVSATVLAQRPGSADLVPAEGAVLELVGGSLRARADGDGNVSLGPLEVQNGTLRLSWDADGDGQADVARQFDLQQIKAGPHRSVNLGLILLGRLGSISGHAYRSGTDAHLGQRGISVFIESSPVATSTADDGSYHLVGVPQGSVSVTYVSDDRAPQVVRYELTAGQALNAADVALTGAAVAPQPATITGQVTDADAHPLEGVEVSAQGATTVTATTDATGHFSLEGLNSGVVALTFSKAGFISTRLGSTLLQAGANTRNVVLVAGIDPGPLDAGTPPQTVRVTSQLGVSPARLADGGCKLPLSVTPNAGDTVLVGAFFGFSMSVDPPAGWTTVSTLNDYDLGGANFGLWISKTIGATPLESELEFGGFAERAAVIVLSGAQTLNVRTAQRFSSNADFTATSGQPGGLSLQAVVPNYEGDTCMQSDAGLPLANLNSITFLAQPFGATGLVPANGVGCALGTTNGEQFQFVVQ